MDLVGPLPPSEGMTYLFTIIDRFTRWPEAIPLPDSKAKTCAQAMIRHWISRFDLPEDITSDRGAQFTSSLWTKLGQVPGVQLHTTTAYHPQANGMIERLHHQLKSSLKARTTDPYWMDHLPLAQLGIRVAWREEPGCSPAELVYGSSLRLPGEFVDQQNSRNTQPSEDFLRHLQRVMHTSLPTPAIYHSKPSSYVPPHSCKANSSTYVLTGIRNRYSVPMMDHFALSQPATKLSFSTLTVDKKKFLSID